MNKANAAAPDALRRRQAVYAPVTDMAAETLKAKA
jgi:hypothetical protein